MYNVLLLVLYFNSWTSEVQTLNSRTHALHCYVSLVPHTLEFDQIIILEAQAYQ